MGHLFNDALAEMAKPRSIIINPGSSENQLSWYHTRYGIYGIASWEEERSDWNISSGLVEADKYSSTNLGFYHPDRDRDDGTLPLLTTMMMLGQIPPTHQGYLSEIMHREIGIDRPALTDVEEIVGIDPFGYRPSEDDSDWHHQFVTRLVAWVINRKLTSELAPLSDAIPGLDFIRAGGVVPFQAEGRWNGDKFYFRYRHGYASLHVSEFDAVSLPRWSATARYGEPLSGFLTMEEFQYLFCFLSNHLKPAPQPYRFNAPLEELPGDRIVYAFSEAEAYQRAEKVLNMSGVTLEGLELLERPPELVPRQTPKGPATNPFLHWATEGEAEIETHDN